MVSDYLKPISGKRAWKLFLSSLETWIQIHVHRIQKLWCTDTVWIRQGHAMYTEWTQILQIKIEVLDTIWHDTLPILKFLCIIVRKLLDPDSDSCVFWPEHLNPEPLCVLKKGRDVFKSLCSLDHIAIYIQSFNHIAISRALVVYLTFFRPIDPGILIWALVLVKTHSQKQVLGLIYLMPDLDPTDRVHVRSGSRYGPIL